MSECIEWTGPIRKDGYGRVYLGQPRGMGLAHRAAYETKVGPIPKGKQLDHVCHTLAAQAGLCNGGPTCRHRRCVNPDHLEPVTQAENRRRGLSGAHERRKTHCPQGHAYVGENLYTDSVGKRHCRACARDRRNR
jgi:hypothetical protein